MLWHRERRYVAIPNMEVWLHLAHLAPDVPDGWSFADAIKFKGMYMQNSTARSRIHACAGGSNKDQLNTMSVEDPPVVATST